MTPGSFENHHTPFCDHQNEMSLQEQWQDHSEEMRRAAVVLCNTGVALMERHSFPQANVVLNNALKVSRFMFRDDRTENIYETNANMLQEKLRTAASMLSNPVKPSPLPNLQVTTIPDDICRSRIDVLLSCDPRAPSSQSTRQIKVFPIRIDDSGLDTLSFDELCGIVAYNFSLSFLCMSKMMPSMSDPRSQGHRCNAMRVLRLCSQIIASDMEISPTSRTFLLTILRLQAMSEALVDHGRIDKASECLNLLEEMVVEAQAYYAMELAFGCRPKRYPAPAA